MATLQQTETTVTAASYERVSKFDSARYGFSLKTQEKDSAAIAAENGWQLAEELRFVDGDTQNASGAEWDLPSLNAMLAAAKRREFSVLIVPDVDRFARNMVKALVLEEELKRYGVRVVYRNMPLEDTPEGRLLKNQLFSIAEYEREKIRMRTERNRREKATRGLYVGNGDAPYGYRHERATVENAARCGVKPGKVIGLVADPETAPVVQRIFREAARKSTREIGAMLAAEGILPLRAGRPRRVGAHRVPYRDTWSPNTIRNILVNPAYRGEATYGRQQKLRPDGSRSHSLDRSTGIAIPVEPLVDVTTWAKAQQALEDRRRVHTARHAWRDTEDPFELRGRLFCAQCEAQQPEAGDRTRQPFSTVLSIKLGGGPSHNRFYVCLRHEPGRASGSALPACPFRSVRADLIEAEAWAKVTEALMDPNRLAAGLAAAEAQHGDAVGQREERLGILDAETARARTRLGRILDELLDAEKGSETYLGLVQRRQQTETLIKRLGVEREALAVQEAPGLTHDEADALRAFAAEVRAGLAHAGPAERAEIYRMLRLRGMVHLDAARGVRFGRGAPVRIEWEAIITLPTCDGVSGSLKLMTSSHSGRPSGWWVAEISRRAA